MDFSKFFFNIPYGSKISKRLVQAIENYILSAIQLAGDCALQCLKLDYSCGITIHKSYLSVQLQIITRKLLTIC
ncbi:MAG: hypothetical protein DRI01_03285 [Chloroflexi bacterium]|nr:MAG: hypothetical protein DRI01_03285 [Chloroflexota bacterium]